MLVCLSVCLPLFVSLFLSGCVFFCLPISLSLFLLPPISLFFSLSFSGFPPLSSPPPPHFPPLPPHAYHTRPRVG